MPIILINEALAISVVGADASALLIRASFIFGSYASASNTALLRFRLCSSLSAMSLSVVSVALLRFRPCLPLPLVS